MIRGQDKKTMTGILFWVYTLNDLLEQIRITFSTRLFLWFTRILNQGISTQLPTNGITDLLESMEKIFKVFKAYLSYRLKRYFMYELSLFLGQIALPILGFLILLGVEKTLDLNLKVNQYYIPETMVYSLNQGYYLWNSWLQKMFYITKLKVITFPYLYLGWTIKSQDHLRSLVSKCVKDQKASREVVSNLSSQLYRNNFYNYATGFASNKNHPLVFHTLFKALNYNNWFTPWNSHGKPLKPSSWITPFLPFALKDVLMVLFNPPSLVSMGLNLLGLISLGYLQLLWLYSLFLGMALLIPGLAPLIPVISGFVPLSHWINPLTLIHWLRPEQGLDLLLGGLNVYDYRSWIAIPVIGVYLGFVGWVSRYIGFNPGVYLYYLGVRIIRTGFNQIFFTKFDQFLFFETLQNVLDQAPYRTYNYNNLYLRLSKGLYQSWSWRVGCPVPASVYDQTTNTYYKVQTSYSQYQTPEHYLGWIIATLSVLNSVIFPLNTMYFSQIQDMIPTLANSYISVKEWYVRGYSKTQVGWGLSLSYLFIKNTTLFLKSVVSQYLLGQSNTTTPFLAPFITYNIVSNILMMDTATNTKVNLTIYISCFFSFISYCCWNFLTGSYRFWSLINVLTSCVSRNNYVSVVWGPLKLQNIKVQGRRLKETLAHVLGGLVYGHFAQIPLNAYKMRGLILGI